MVDQQSAGAHEKHIGQVWTNQQGEVVRITLIGAGGKQQIFVAPGQFVPVDRDGYAADEAAENVSPTTPHVKHVAIEQMKQAALFQPPKGYQRVCGSLVDFEHFNRFYPGRTPQTVIFEKGFQTAVDALRKNGVVINAVELVLWAGATRAMQVARWAARKQELWAGTSKEIRDLGNFTAETLWAGPPQARKVAV